MELFKYFTSVFLFCINYNRIKKVRSFAKNFVELKINNVNNLLLFSKSSTQSFYTNIIEIIPEDSDLKILSALKSAFNKQMDKYRKINIFLCEYIRMMRSIENTVFNNTCPKLFYKNFSQFETFQDFELKQYEMLDDVYQMMINKINVIL